MEILYFHVNVIRVLFTNLEELCVNKLPDELNLNNLFGQNFAISYTLKYLAIRSSSTKFHILGGENFSSLAVIEEIDLNYCGIQFIQIDTFTNIYRTLKTVLLIGNNLTILDLTMFYPLIEILANNDLHWYSFNLINNPLECNCNLYEFNSILFISWINKFDLALLQQLYLKCVTHFIHEMDPLICPAQQIIHPSKLCIQNINRNPIYYPKFILKWDELEQNVIINVIKKYKYRLWIHNMTSVVEFNSKWGYLLHQKCPVKRVLQTSIRCFILSHTTEKISLSVFNRTFEMESTLAQFCINFVTGNPKKIWPLHCITVNRDQLTTNRDIDNVFLMNLQSIAMCIVYAMFFIGLIMLIFGISYCFYFYCLTKAKPINDNESDLSRSMDNEYESICGSYADYCYAQK